MLNLQNCHLLLSDLLGLSDTQILHKATIEYKNVTMARKHVHELGYNEGCGLIWEFVFASTVGSMALEH